MNKSRYAASSDTAADLYSRYAKDQQTLNGIAREENKNCRSLQRCFDSHTFITGDRTPDAHEPLAVPVTMDVTFVGKREGLLLCRSSDKRNLWWQEVESETVSDYSKAVQALFILGYTPTAFVIDGRAGVRQMLEKQYPHIPIQYCQFHQIQTVKQYIPKKAKNKAAQQLRKIALQLSQSYETQFITALKIWHVLHKDYLNEKTYNTDPTSKRKWWYTHRRLRSAYHSLKRNLAYLFTYQNHSHLNIPNTTNHCDGFFAHLKERVKRHRGLRHDRKWKMIHYLLENW